MNFYLRKKFLHTHTHLFIFSFFLVYLIDLSSFEWIIISRIFTSSSASPFYHHIYIIHYTFIPSIHAHTHTLSSFVTRVTKYKKKRKKKKKEDIFLYSNVYLSAVSLTKTEHETPWRYLENRVRYIHPTLRSIFIFLDYLLSVWKHKIKAK